MNSYTTKQFSILTTGVFVFIMLVLYFSYYYSEGEIGLEEFVLGEIILAAVTSLFYNLTIEVTEQNINLKFGIGLIRRSIPLKKIDSAECVRNKWWYGWGIRLTPHGWLWNVGGLDAVEIKYKNKDRKFRMGTNQSQQLKMEIDKRIKRMENKK